MPNPEPITEAPLRTLPAGDAAEKGQSPGLRGTVVAPLSGKQRPSSAHPASLRGYQGPGSGPGPSPPWQSTSHRHSSGAQAVVTPLLCLNFPICAKGPSECPLVGNRPSRKSACTQRLSQVSTMDVGSRSDYPHLQSSSGHPICTDHHLPPSACSCPALSALTLEGHSPGFTTVQSPQSRTPGGCV